MVGCIYARGKGDRERLMGYLYVGGDGSLKYCRVQWLARHD